MAGWLDRLLTGPLDDAVESRSGGYTDSITAAFESAAGDGDGSNPLRTAALEACAALYATSFAAARVTPDRAARVLTPAVRALMARRLVRQGEDVHRIVFERGRLRVLPAGYWTVQGGGAREEGWRYQLTEYGPSASETLWERGDAVVHCRYAVDGARPWQGVPPWSWAGDSATAIGRGEDVAATWMNNRPGLLVAAGDGQAGPEAPKLRKMLEMLRGRTAFLASPGGYDGNVGQLRRGFTDFHAEPLGPRPSEGFVTLRSDTAAAVTAACGVPPGLLDPRTDGASQRESWRRFALGALAGMAALVEAECEAKLDVPVRFDFEPLRAFDMVARATALRRMVDAGMELPAAVAASGVLGE